MPILIGVETETWLTSEGDHESDSPYAERDSYDGRVTNVWASYSESEPRTWSDSIVIEEPKNFNGTLFAVVADYSSGDTFGRDGGYAQILDAFADNETAEALAKAALKQAPSNDWRDQYNFTFNGKEYHKSWEGYFECLNALDVWEIQVRKYPVDPFRDKEEDDDTDFSAVKPGRKVGK
jgi:hypothetical protein